ncbi:MAG: hypothetical protein H6816_06560 [Phycisphaerales bacterium]|nr:hypothetical protein [Phycisphaerales bacterium]
MKRQRQTVEGLLATLSAIDASWLDDHARLVAQALGHLADRAPDGPSGLRALLEQDFQAGWTVVRLVLDMSKDEFTLALRNILGAGGIGIKRFKAAGAEYVGAIASLGYFAHLKRLIETPVSWQDILLERLKSGRGSAIKGQARGRRLEDGTEQIVNKVFSDVGFDKRCRFVGASGRSTEKADFAIPSKEDPAILIEVKAYGATGSKQTDILGDIARIAEQKRHDTHLLLVTDGTTWSQRINDLRKLVDMQNRGLIARIYTQRMFDDLDDDLTELRRTHDL